MRYSCESDCGALCYGGFPKRWFYQIMLKKLFQIDPVCQRFKKKGTEPQVIKLEIFNLIVR